MNGKSLVLPGLGIILLIFFLLIPPIAPLTPLGMKVLGIFAFTITWWAAIGIGYPSMLCVALFVLTKAMPPNPAYGVSWGSWLNLFLIGVFGLSEAMSLTGFSRRFALWFVSRPFNAGRPWMMLAMFLLSCTLLGSVTTGGAVCAIFMAIAEPMLTGLGYKKGDTFAATIMMGIAWTSTASFVMTPIGHSSNLLLIEWVKRDMGYNINFFQWMLVGVPVGLLFYLLIIGYFRFVARPDVSKFSDMATKWVREEEGKMGPLSVQEKIAVGVFLTAVLFWIFPGVAGGLFPGAVNYLNTVGYAIPGIVGSCLLCFIEIKRKPIMTFHQWMAGVPWQTIALVAAIMIIGDAIGNPKTGIADFLTGIFQPLAKSAPFFVYRLIGQLWVVLQTNFMSNLVSATTVYTAMVPAAIAANLGNQVALGWSIFAGARAAFALPSATDTTAMVSGSGWVPLGYMARHGFAVSIGMLIIVAFFVYPLAALVFR